MPVIMTMLRTFFIVPPENRLYVEGSMVIYVIEMKSFQARTSAWQQQDEQRQRDGDQYSLDQYLARLAAHLGQFGFIFDLFHRFRQFSCAEPGMRHAGLVVPLEETNCCGRKQQEQRQAPQPVPPQRQKDGQDGNSRHKLHDAAY